MTRCRLSTVGLAAIQVANYAGATTIATTRTYEKKKQLLAMGAAHVIVTDDADLVKEIMRITGGNGVRVVFDSIGGPNFARLVSVLAPFGTALIYGALADGPTSIPVLEMIGKLLTVKAHNIWLTSGDATRQKAAVEFILRGLETGALRPVIDRT